jgi:tRNA A-37 threonylcarbamoyl transferase component Bud32
VAGVDFNAVRALFLELRGIEDSDARRHALRQRCNGNEDLQREVESLLGFAQGPQPHAAFVDKAAVPGALSSVLAEVADEQAGLPDVIGQYRIVRIVGEGGMGTVFEARQQRPHRRVALKVLRPGIASRAVLRRFEQEAQILARLQHVGIAQVYESGDFGPPDRPSKAQPFFAMEFIEGEPISEHLAKRRGGAREALTLCARVADAVEHAHVRGVVHRDLKPANILVTADGQPKVLDFGVARAQDGAGQRSDVYSLGVVLYELLTGRLPHDVRDGSITDAARRITSEDPARLSAIRRELRGDVETIVLKALEKDPQRRYQSAGELAADLRRCLEDRPIAARPATAIYQLRKFARRNRALVAGVTLAAAALAAAAVVSTIFAFSENRLRKVADDNKAEADAKSAQSRRMAYRLALSAADALSATDPVKARTREGPNPTGSRPRRATRLGVELPAPPACRGGGGNSRRRCRGLRHRQWSRARWTRVVRHRALRTSRGRGCPDRSDLAHLHGSGGPQAPGALH